MTRLLATLSLFSMGLVLTPALVAQTTIVNHLTMNQWVSPAEDGTLNGRVMLPQADGEVDVLPDVTVSIMGRDGKVLRAKSDSTGAFSIKGVSTGVYALTARGDNVFACCAMHVIDARGDLRQSFPEVADITVANVDYTVVNTAIIRYLPPNVKTEIVSIAEAKLSGIANQVCGNELFRVAQADGGMRGRLHVAGAIGSELQGANMTNVFIFKGGMQIDRTLTDDRGEFEIDDIEAGHYSLLAVGPGGVGLIGFELVDESELVETVKTVDNTSSGTEKLVGLGGHHSGACCCQEFSMQVAPLPQVVGCVEEVVVAETIVDSGCGAGCDPGTEIVDGGIVMDGFGTPLAGGGCCSSGGGGYYGGGGGGYGGGGYGGLGALAAIGAIGVVAATSDDDDVPFLTPVVASPAVPN